MVTRRTRTLVVGLLLGIAALLAYANSFSVPFLLDDWATIQENPQLRRVWPLTAALTPPENTGVGGRPIANVVFVLNYALTGDSLAGYHAGNLLIHFAAALVLFGLVRRTLALSDRAGPRRGLAPDWLAAGVAALWMLHPLQTQSVTYISQRTESLMGLLYLTTLYAFLRSVTGGTVWRLATVAACALGMGTKEGMVTAPVAVLLFDRWFVAGSLASAWRLRRSLYLGLAATWLILPYLMSGLTGRGVGFGAGLTPWNYALLELDAITRYLGLGLWPGKLVFDYGIDLAPPGGHTVVAAAVVLGMLALALAGWRGRRPVGFCAAWFLLTLAPTSSVVPIPLQPIAENRVYLPLAGLMAAGVLALGRLRPREALAALGLAATAAGALTFARNATYGSEITLWRDTLAKTTRNSRAHNNLGYSLFYRHGRVVEARAEYEAALAINPDFGDAHLNLAAALGSLGSHDAAVQHARRATELNPRSEYATFNLGVGLTYTGNLPAATTAMERAIQLRPTYAEAQSALALLYGRQNRNSEALTRAELALRLKPTLSEPRLTMGLAHLQEGRIAAAQALLEDYVHREPAQADGPYLLGLCHLKQGRTAEAIAALETAVRLNPQHKGAVNALAQARAARTP